ncbi:phosphopantetheine-binding protein [Streptomyces ochraceiscleroticus]|nr:phosphopantetheine-binding protein [Streptomyces ochraceiscleroticus]
MIPELLVEAAALPLTANGKVDRAEVVRQLRGARPQEQTLEAPRGETEPALAAEWRELLGVDRLGRDQSFFVLGGDSLLATRLVESVRKSSGVVVTLREFLAAPTVRQLAELIESRRPSASEPMDEGSI